VVEWKGKNFCRGDEFRDALVVGKRFILVNKFMLEELEIERGVVFLDVKGKGVAEDPVGAEVEF